MANYITVRDGIAGRLKSLGFIPSSQIVDFSNASSREYGNTYILKCLSGENRENTIIDRFEDAQVWQILIAFERSENSDTTNYDIAQLKKDAIIKDLDKPSNWTSFVKVLKYNTWEMKETPNYYVLDIRLSVIDQYIHG